MLTAGLVRLVRGLLTYLFVHDAAVAGAFAIRSDRFKVGLRAPDLKLCRRLDQHSDRVRHRKRRAVASGRRTGRDVTRREVC